jgi:hypothetical protein
MPPKFAHNQADQDHHLYQRGGRWYIRYELGGVEQRKSLGTADVKKARKERDRILKGVDDRRDGKAPAPAPVIHSWQDAVDGYPAHLEAQARADEISTATVRRYEVSWVQITAGLAVGGR